MPKKAFIAEAFPPVHTLPGQITTYTIERSIGLVAARHQATTRQPLLFTRILAAGHDDTIELAVVGEHLGIELNAPDFVYPQQSPVVQCVQVSTK